MRDCTVLEQKSARVSYTMTAIQTESREEGEGKTEPGTARSIGLFVHWLCDAIFSKEGRYYTLLPCSLFFRRADQQSFIHSHTSAPFFNRRPRRGATTVACHEKLVVYRAAMYGHYGSGSATSSSQPAGMWPPPSDLFHNG